MKQKADKRALVVDPIRVGLWTGLGVLLLVFVSFAVVQGGFFSTTSEAKDAPCITYALRCNGKRTFERCEPTSTGKSIWGSKVGVYYKCSVGNCDAAKAREGINPPCTHTGK